MLHRWRPDAVWVERGAEDSPMARRVLGRVRNVPVHVVDDVRAAHDVARFVDGKRRLVLQPQHGTFLHHCPAGTTGLVCCNYLVTNFVSNCPYDCTYCFLQDYLANNAATRVFTNPEAGLAEIDTVLRAHPERTFRIGTGELADSLALDPFTELSGDLVPFFAERENALLELKTKSTCVEHLLRLDPKDRVVVSWSVNAEAVVVSEERGTPSLVQRLAAAERVQAAGYRVGFHFDPLIAHEGWEEGYRAIVARLFERLDTRRVAWVSLGSLRMTPGLKAAIRARADSGRVLTTELVPGADGKDRVWRGLRVKMYRKMLEWLRDVDERLPLYICMEPAGIWERAMGEAPTDRDLAERLVSVPG
jgi:spore photoproduct lyase